MRILAVILGVFVLSLGLFWTGYCWYVAESQNKIDSAQVYVGPVFIILGLLRILSATSAVKSNIFLRICAIGIGLLLGLGNSMALKAAFPTAQEISSTSTH